VFYAIAFIVGWAAGHTYAMYRERSASRAAWTARRDAFVRDSLARVRAAAA
jgi:hypothetical protein